MRTVIRPSAVNHRETRLEYRSPIGPVRLEIGWKLDPESGEDNDPVFFLSFGNPF